MDNKIYKKFLVFFVIVFSFFINGIATSQVIDGMFKVLQHSPESNVLLNNMITNENSVLSELNVSQLNKISTTKFQLKSIPISANKTVDIDFVEFKPYNDKSVITATGINGIIKVTPTIKIFRGKIIGDIYSKAYLAVSDKIVEGSFTLNGEQFIMKNVSDSKVPLSFLKVVSFPSKDMNHQEFKSGVDDKSLNYLAPKGYVNEFEKYWRDPKNALTKDDEKQYEKRMQGKNTISDYTLDMLIDCDYEYFANSCNSDLQIATDHALAVMGLVSEAYERDIKVQLNVSKLNVWTSNSDPYTQSVASAYLTELSNYWAGQNDDRGLVHVFTGKNMGSVGGIAWVKTLCSRSNGAALSKIQRYDVHEDAFIVAHETGHNFGCLHTHSCSWNPEIDRCAAAEEGNCFSQVVQSRGTIMSYCSLTDLVFHPKCIKFLEDQIIKPGVPCFRLSKKLNSGDNIIQMVFPKAGGVKTKDTTLVGYFSNGGKLPVTVTKMRFIGDTTGWKIGIKIPFTLQAGESRDLVISYTPDSIEVVKAELEFDHDALNLSPVKVLIEAYFYKKYDFTIQPRLGLVAGSKKEIIFKKLKMGFSADTSIPRMYKNLGTLALIVTKTELVGSNTNEFEILQGEAPFDLKTQSDAKTFAIRFKPNSPGLKTCWLKVESNSSAGVDSVKISGEAIKGSIFQLNVDKLSIDFGKRKKQVLYDTNFVSFMVNVGTDTGYISGDLDGVNKEDFSTSIEALLSLAPGKTEGLQVTLFAKKDGLKTAFIELSIYSNPDSGIIARRDTIFLIAAVGNVGGVNDEGIATGKLKMLPNPVVGKSTVNFKVLESEIGKNFIVMVSDVNGKTVFKKNGVCNSLDVNEVIDFTDLPGGKYNVIVKATKSLFKGNLIIVK
ncbi:MAG: zinc-dependent metalloprotease [Chlorobiota bacterium]|nr:zinc-dependent metalloprotease [Chlorobiota bacterium]QQS65805.1 MAG: zinc-dependent metalloprotease [Chlorobiota bacterium]